MKIASTSKIAGSIDDFNYNANNPGFEHHTEEQIVSGALDTVSKSEDEKSGETQCTSEP